MFRDRVHRACRDGHIVAIDGLEARAPGAPLGPRPASEHLAYVMYTSGTSGEPKGVCIEHRQAVAFVCWARSAYSRDELRSIVDFLLAAAA